MGSCDKVGVDNRSYALQLTRRTILFLQVDIKYPSGVPVFKVSATFFKTIGVGKGFKHNILFNDFMVELTYHKYLLCLLSRVDHSKDREDICRAEVAFFAEICMTRSGKQLLIGC